MTEARHSIGVDVGTGSARAGVFDMRGRQLATASAEIGIHRAPGGIVEQSSADIWAACCKAVREAVSAAGVAPETVAGLGFDATCSLVVLGQGGRPLPVGDPDASERDVIVWMDHRATEQAARINAGGYAVLDYVGGRISPEMQTPKLLWLRENRSPTFDAAWQFFDLTDFLGWRATGATERSSCTVTCKWTYLAHEDRWDPDYFHAIGLGVLADEDFARIGVHVVRPGTALGHGLTEAAAAELGLSPGIAVGAGLIDAHAGGVGTVGPAEGPEANLAYVFGTSSCTMTSTSEPVFVPGVWGPYFEAMVPGLWLNEGGQSAAGAAIAHLIRHHPHAPAAEGEARAAGLSLPAWLAAEAERRCASLSAAAELAAGVHVVPEFLGNRAPFADPETRAVVSGLGMDDGLDSLLALYIAGICGIGYGLRQIIEAQAKKGIRVSRVVLSGGAGRHPLVRQLLADSADIEIAVPAAEEPVLLGSAILGGVAGGAFATIPDAMSAMTVFAEHLTPDPAQAAHHDQRFELFSRFQSVARDAAHVSVPHEDYASA
ncbi:FGGY-family carbohydrate kinase [Tranquillimonas alkanivorans]|uniref:D-ribulokinase n=1 Tax=Tranquillimonas alkanivorans TaxID=441119 RepID=A0A1I5RRB3_9RHOB|nr:FGGY-family carbohydrate kinase [Tranquillimonas alkanivorans]SFP61055.1 D-ribulokinase [Tranquillimonas alkanivorans]